MKRCCKHCGVEQAISLFPKAGNVKGVQYYRHRCGACYVSLKRVYKRRVRVWLDAHKQSLLCVDCGFDDWRALQFDHVDRKTKIGNIADLAKRWSIKRLQTEIDKCEVRCANCHQIKTHEYRA